MPAPTSKPAPKKFCQALVGEEIRETPGTNAGNKPTHVSSAPRIARPPAMRRRRSFFAWDAALSSRTWRPVRSSRA